MAHAIGIKILGELDEAEPILASAHIVGVPPLDFARECRPEYVVDHVHITETQKDLLAELVHIKAQKVPKVIANLKLTTLRGVPQEDTTLN